MILRYLSEGFALGLALSVTCLGTCGPLYTSYLLQKKSGVLGSAIIVLKLSAGRFVSYGLFGAFAGIIGRQIGDFNREWFTTAAYILCSVLLIASVFQTRRHDRGCAMARWHKLVDSPLLLGLATGLNFCPSFLIAVTRAVDVSGPLSGTLIFVAFFFGSNLPLFWFAFFGILGDKKLFNRIGSFFFGSNVPSFWVTLFNALGNRTLFNRIGMASALVVSAYFLSRAGMTGYKLVTEEKKFNEALAERDVISVLDSSIAFILTPDTSGYDRFIAKMRESRPGPVAFASPGDSLPKDGTVFVDKAWLDAYGKKPDSLKRPGLFIVVLPEPEKNGSRDDAYAEKIVSFLKNYYFKFDKRHGSIFKMERFMKKRDSQ